MDELTTTELYEALKILGVEVLLDNQCRAKYKCPKGVMNPFLLKIMSERKFELIRLTAIESKDYFHSQGGGCANLR